MAISLFLEQQHHLRPVLGHSLLLQALKLDTKTAFLDLALLLFLWVLKVPLVTELNQVSRLADFSLETTEGRFNGLAITDIDLDADWEFCQYRSSTCCCKLNSRGR